MTYPTLALNVQEATRAFKTKLGIHFADSRSVLFGSRAKNRAHPESDADIAVLLPGSPGKFIATKFFMDDLAYEVWHSLKSVDKYYCQNLNWRNANANAKSQIHT